MPCMDGLTLISEQQASEMWSSYSPLFLLADNIVYGVLIHALRKG